MEKYPSVENLCNWPLLAYRMIMRLSTLPNEILFQIIDLMHVNKERWDDLLSVHQENVRMLLRLLRRLTCGNYPVGQKENFANMIWAYIQSPTGKAPERNRSTLLENLHQNERDYLTSFYERQELQFVTAYTRIQSNLGCSSTQRGEHMHPVVKEVLTLQLIVERLD